MVEIFRFYKPTLSVENQKDGTLGFMRMGGKFFCYTLEPPWRNNELDSCIPEGKYICKRYNSVRYPDVFQITGVKNRTQILIHSGNIDDHTMGCILLGSGISKIKGCTAVTNSRNTLKLFMSVLHILNEFKLRITEV